jgi:microcystin-dependent protein
MSFYNINGKSIGIPAGAIFGSARHTTDPPGYVIANGVARTDGGTDLKYSALLALSIGTGTNANYTPPNLQGSFLRSSGSQTIGQLYTGSTFKSFQHNQIQVHTHTGSSSAHTHATSSTATNAYDASAGKIGLAVVNGLATEATNNSNDNDQVNVFKVFDVSFSVAASQSITVADSGNNANETAPFCYGVNWLIKL